MPKCPDEGTPNPGEIRAGPRSSFGPLSGGFGHRPGRSSARFALRSPRSFYPRDVHRETCHDVVHGSTVEAVRVRCPGRRARSIVGALPDGLAAGAERHGGLRTALESAAPNGA